MPTPHVAALYLRVSTLVQAAGDKYSLDTQRDGCLRHAAKLDIDTDPNLEFRESYSGEDLLWDGSVFMRAVVRAAREHLFDSLIVYDLDRFSRGGGGPGLDAMELLESCGVRIYS